MISQFFHVVFFQPLYNALIFLVDVLPFHDFGLAIIILTLAVRVLLFPLTHKSVVVQRKMKEIAPKLTEIKEKHKDNKEEQMKQTMAIYKEHGISPFSGIFIMLIQLPILFALFFVLKGGVELIAKDIYPFVHFPEQIKMMFLGVIDLSRPNYILAITSALSQFFQIHLSAPNLPKAKKDMSFGSQLQRSMAFQTKFIMPLFILFIATRFSAGLALYWTVSNVFAIVHEIVVAKKAKLAYVRTNSNSKENNRRNTPKDDTGGKN